MIILESKLLDARGLSVDRDSTKNIILLTVDCLRYDHVTEELMPNLWRRMQEGTVYTKCHAEYGHTIDSFQTLFESEWIYKVHEAGYHTIGINYNPWIGRDFGYSNGFDYWHDWQDYDGILPVLDDAEELNSLFFSIPLQNKQPFFAWLHYMDCHVPYYPYREKDDIMALADVGAPFMKPTKEIARELHSRYKYAVKHLDASIGQFIEVLERKGLKDNTVIIISADHGEEFMEHGRLGHDADRTCEEVLHVPLIVLGNGTETNKEKVTFRHISTLILNELS